MVLNPPAAKSPRGNSQDKTLTAGAPRSSHYFRINIRKESLKWSMWLDSHWSNLSHVKRGDRDILVLHDCYYDAFKFAFPLIASLFAVLLLCPLVLLF